jgi:20S proteasome alpha/beta subunit
VTVCIAALMRWNYAVPGAAPNWGNAAIVLSDRMITVGDTQFEPSRQKVAQITDSIALVIAGDYSLHSEAVKRTINHFRARQSASPLDVSVYYGRVIQQLKLKEAEDIFLAPLGLNSDSFLAQQKDMAPHFVSHLTEQLQGYRAEEDVEALVTGGHEARMHMYFIDGRGSVSCLDDLGFGAIGSGSWHARSRLMQVGYSADASFPAAIGLTFAAKRAAEIAPGVGASYTDIHLIFWDKIERLVPDVAAKVDELFKKFKPKADALGMEYIAELNDYIASTPRGADGLPKIPGGSAQADGSVDTSATKAPSKDEGGPEKIS